MLATMEIVDVLDSAEALGKMLCHSEEMENYKQKKEALASDKEAQSLIRAFLRIKDQYEDVERFGRYHPDYNKIMKEIRESKRAMDMHEAVAQFKIAERKLENLVDEVSQLLAHSVSPHIKTPRANSLLKDDSGCGCGSGGSCGCH